MVAAFPLVFQTPAAAQSLQDFHLGTWEGSMGLEYGQGAEELRTSDGTPAVTTTRHRVLEEVTIANRGFYYLSPAFAVADLSVTFGASQLRESTDGITNTNRAKVLAYAFDASILAPFPYNGRLYANRNNSIETQPFGHTDLTFENAGATLQLREDSPLRDRGFPFFSASLNAEHQHVRETTTSALGQSFQQNETRNLVNASAHKGFETSDLDLNYEYIDVRDASLPQLDFTSQLARANYSIDFGPTLNCRADSSVNYYMRSGLAPLTLAGASGFVHIDHQDNLATNYRLIADRTETPSNTTTQEALGFDVRYQPFRELSGTGTITGQHTDLRYGTRATSSAALSLDFDHGVPGNGRLNLNVGGRYQLNDNRLSSSRVSVSDEAYSAPSIIGAGTGFALKQRFVVAASIVVVDTRGGARLPTAASVDYEIVVKGNATQINPLPTSAVIRPGDPLLVSYEYDIDPSVKYSVTTGSASIALSYGWIGLSYAHAQSRDTLLSGTDSGYLDDTRSDTAQVNLQGAWRRFDAQLVGTFVRYNATHLGYRQQQYQATFNYRPTPALVATLTMNRTLTEYTVPVERTDGSSTQLSFDWSPALRGWSSWTTSASIGRSVLRDTLQPTETVTAASLRQRMTYGKLDLSATLVAAERTRGDVTTRNWGFDLAALRRF